MQRIRKMTAGLTLVAFAAVACTQGATIEPREITVETWRAGDQEPTLWTTTKVSLADIAFARTIVIDDVASVMTIASIPEATFVVPLNNGETATVRKTKSRLELVSFTGPKEDAAGKPRGTVTAVELRGDDGFALFYADSPGTEADVLIKLRDVAAVDREVVRATLALQSLVLSLEDVEQNIWVAMAILVASVSAWWLWQCYDTAQSCADRCDRWGYPNWSSTCGDLTVNWVNEGLSFGGNGAHSCQCF